MGSAATAAPPAPPLLEIATELPGIGNGRARVAIYGVAGEAVVSTITAPRPWVDRSRKGAAAQDPERCRRESARRAKRALRLYAKSNRLVVMVVLTYAGMMTDKAAATRHVERVLAKMRAHVGEKFPSVWVFEWQKRGVLHVHLAIPFRYPVKLLADQWTHGFVKLTDKRRGVGRDESFAQAARLSSYLAKYVGKTFEDEDLPEEQRYRLGEQRYRPAQGFQPQCVRVRRWDIEDGEEFAEAVFGVAPAAVWRSLDADEWRAPPVSLLTFDRVPPGWRGGP